MKSLFDKNFKYTDEAALIENRWSALLMQDFNHFYSLGFSPKEIAVVLHNLISEIELETIIKNDSKVDKNE